MKVYIVTWGSKTSMFGDFDIEGVFSTLEGAQRYGEDIAPQKGYDAEWVFTNNRPQYELWGSPPIHPPGGNTEVEDLGVSIEVWEVDDVQD